MKKYYYLFYKIYEFSEMAPSRWLSDWKASFTIDVLILLIFTSIINYIKVYVYPNSTLGEDNLLLIVGIIICLINYFIFHHKDKWKDYVKEFDKLSIKKNRLGSFYVLCFILLVFINFILSFYLFYEN